MRTLSPAPGSLYDAHGAPRFGAYQGGLPPVDLRRLAATKLELVHQAQALVLRRPRDRRASSSAAPRCTSATSRRAFAFVYDRKERRLLADRSTLAPPFGQRIADTAGEGCDVRFRALGARFDVQRGHGARELRSRRRDRRHQPRRRPSTTAARPPDLGRRAGPRRHPQRDREARAPPVTRRGRRRPASLPPRGRPRRLRLHPRPPRPPHRVELGVRARPRQDRRAASP